MVNVTLKRDGKDFRLQFRGHAGKGNGGVEACAILSCLARMMQISGAAVTRKTHGKFNCRFKEKNAVGLCTAIFLTELEDKYSSHVKILRSV